MSALISVEQQAETFVKGTYIYMHLYGPIPEKEIQDQDSETKSRELQNSNYGTRQLHSCSWPVQVVVLDVAARQLKVERVSSNNLEGADVEVRCRALCEIMRDRSREQRTRILCWWKDNLGDRSWSQHKETA
jgi:hypothetical protein